MSFHTTKSPIMNVIIHHIQISADKLPGKKSGCCCRPALVANAMGWEPHGWAVQFSAVAAALSTACFLLWSERRLGQLQEAVIGAVFVVAASAELILLAFNPHGAEHLKDLLVGQILWVELHQLIPVAVLYGAVLLAFAMFDLRRQRLCSICCLPSRSPHRYS